MAEVSSSKIAWGILGTGNIARQFCKGVKSGEGGILMAVGSRSAGPAAEFAGQFGVLNSYPTYDQVLKDPQVDAVYISLPNSMHHEWAIRALEAGKHVLCEKPIASNEAQAREMFAAARSSAKYLIEAFMYRAHPQTREVLDKIKSGAIGDVKLIRTSFCYRTNRVEGNIRFDPALAGGALMDIGCYCINFSRAIAGADISEIHASGALHERGVDELVAGHLKFTNGIVASFTCGMRVQADNSAYICGTDGYLEIPWPWKPQPRGAKYWIKRSAPPKQDGGKTDTPPAEEFEVNAGMDLYAVEADDFAETILRGRPPMVSEEESLATMRVLDEMRKQVGVKL